MCDHCEQSEQKTFQISKILGTVLTKFLCDQCEQSEQNPFKYWELLETVLNKIFMWSMWTKWTKPFQMVKFLGTFSN